MSAGLRIWLIISTMILVGVVLIYILPSQCILDAAPKCAYKVLFNRECYSCGMTRGFIEASKFHIESANNLNKAAFTLFLLCLLNSIVFIIFVIRYIFKSRSNK